MRLIYFLTFFNFLLATTFAPPHTSSPPNQLLPRHEIALSHGLSLIDESSSLLCNALLSSLTLCVCYAFTQKQHLEEKLYGRSYTHCMRARESESVLLRLKNPNASAFSFLNCQFEGFFFFFFTYYHQFLTQKW